jgi:hypothetical protein
VRCSLAGEDSRVVFSVTAASSGNFYVRTQTNSKMDGARTLGPYRGSNETTDLIYAQRGATFTFVDHLNIIGQGHPNHFIVHTVFRFHIDESGAVSDPVVDHALVKCDEVTIGA